MTRTTPLTIECDVHFDRRGSGLPQVAGNRPATVPPCRIRPTCRAVPVDGPGHPL